MWASRSSEADNAGREGHHLGCGFIILINIHSFVDVLNSWTKKRMINDKLIKYMSSKQFQVGMLEMEFKWEFINNHFSH